MNRTNKSFKNLFFALLKYLTLTILTFVVRAVFARKLDAAYLGVNGLFTNILSVLSIVELGVGSSIVYSMYKVVANDEKEKINSLLYLYRKIYMIIAVIVTVIGVSLLPFLPNLVDVSEVPNINIYLAYIIFLADSVISYLAAYRRSVVFIYQRADVEYKTGIIKIAFLHVAQIIVLLTCTNFYLFLLMMPISTLLDSLLIIGASKRMYPDIKPKKGELEKETIDEIKKNTKATLIHKIGGVTVYSTDNILISAIVGLTVLGIYSNYYVIITALVSFINLISNSIKSSIGNYIAVEEKEKAKNLFDKLTFLFMCLSIFCSVCYFCICNSFVEIWLGKDYLLPVSTVLLISVSLFLNVCKSVTGLYRDCCGLMDKDKYRVFSEVTINLVVSIILGRFMGLNGIIIGTIISTITGPLVSEPFVVYKHYFKMNFTNYISLFFKYVLALLLVGGGTYFVSTLLPTGGIMWLIIKMMTVVAICFALVVLIFVRNRYLKEYWILLRSVIGFRKKEGNN